MNRDRPAIPAFEFRFPIVWMQSLGVHTFVYCESVDRENIIH